MTMWDADKDPRSPVPFDLVDEFVFNHTEAAGQDFKRFDIEGIRPAPKTE